MIDRRYDRDLGHPFYSTPGISDEYLICSIEEQSLGINVDISPGLVDILISSSSNTLGFAVIRDESLEHSRSKM